MGLFSKAKDMLGGQGVTVEFTRLERQDPKSAHFPVTDSVFKGNYNVKAEKDAVVLKHIHRAYLRVNRPDGGYDEFRLAEEVHDKTTKIYGADIEWPYKIVGGQSKKDGFILHDIDIPAYLREVGYYNPNDAVGDPNVKLIIEVIADVKGSPFDPKSEIQVALSGENDAAVQPSNRPVRPLVFFEDGYYEATITESNESGHHIQWDDGTESWVASDAVLPNGTVVPQASQLQAGQRIVARFEAGFYESTVNSVDPGDMVNPAKVLVSWDDGTESWVAVSDVRMI